MHKPTFSEGGYFFVKTNIDICIEPFYIDHKRLNLLTKTKLFQLKLSNFSLLLIAEKGGDKLKPKHWHKSKYRTVYNLNDRNLQQGKANIEQN